MRTSLQGPSVPVHPTGLLRRVRPRIASSGDASSSPGQGNLLLGMRCPYRHFFVVLSSGRHCTGFNLNTVHKLSSTEKNLGAAGIRIRGIQECLNASTVQCSPYRHKYLDRSVVAVLFWSSALGCKFK